MPGKRRCAIGLLVVGTGLMLNGCGQEITDPNAYVERGLPELLSAQTIVAPLAASKASDDVGAICRRAVDDLARGEFQQAVDDGNAALVVDPDAAQAHYIRGLAYEVMGKYGHAITDYQLAARADKQNAEYHVRLAWLLAGAPDARLRDGKVALNHAMRASALTEAKEPQHLEAMAAAYAETGDFESALKWEKKALDLLTDARKVSACRSLIARYKAKEPFRFPKRATDDQN